MACLSVTYYWIIFTPTIHDFCASFALPVSAIFEAMQQQGFKHVLEKHSNT